MRPIPLILVVGFLGSGKTTLMRRLIGDGHARGLKLSLVINEFGVTDIDSQLLRDNGVEMASSLAGGCACCSGQEEMINTLRGLGERTGEDRPDVILMEASGLADPVSMLDAITVAQLLPLVRLGALVAVVDSARFLLMPSEMVPLLFRQIVLADFLLQNKIDIAYKREHREMHADVTKELREVNLSAPIYQTKGAWFEMNDLWTRALNENAQHRVLDRDVVHLTEAPHAHTNTITFPLRGPVSREQLQAAFAELPRNVWRVKGFVRFDDEDGLHLLQYVGAALSAQPQLNISPFRLSVSKEAHMPETSLVCIGPDLDFVALSQHFEATQIQRTSTRLTLIGD